MRSPVARSHSSAHASPTETMRWRRSPSFSALLVTIGLASASSVQGQVAPLGPEFQVNTMTTGNQYGSKITAAPDGSFVVVWFSGFSPFGIHGQRFTAAGLPVGDELTMDEQTPPVVGPLDVATEADGDFVLVWGHGNPGCPSCWDDFIKGRRFVSDGTPAGAQFAVSESDAYIGDAAIAAHPDGSFVVVWEDDYDPRALRFDSGGAPIGSAFPLPIGPNVAGFAPDATVLPDGGTVLSWVARDDEALHTVLAQRYDSGGVPVDDPFTIAGPSAHPFAHDLAASATAGLVVVTAGPPGIVSGRRFDTNGTPLGPEFQVNSYLANPVDAPKIHHSPSGDFVVTWQSAGSPGNDNFELSVQARRFAADGTPLGNQFQVNSEIVGYQYRPHATTLPNSDLVVVWTGPGETGSEIKGRIFRVPFFMDGFENGTTNRWSASVELRN